MGDVYRCLKNEEIHGISGLGKLAQVLIRTATHGTLEQISELIMKKNDSMFVKGEGAKEGCGCNWFEEMQLPCRHMLKSGNKT